MLRLVVLNDNEETPGLRNEWGWSILVDTGSERVLFDADTDYRVIEYNAAKLGINLSGIDYAVLSHWHRDHYGGFPALARRKPGARVYTPPGPTYRLERLGLEVVVNRGASRLSSNVLVTEPLYSSSVGLYEQSLVVSSARGPVLIVGCSHPGVDVIAGKAVELLGEYLYMVIGGFHSPPAPVLDRLAGYVTGVICPAHCSGEEAKRYVEERYPDKACRVRTGTEIIIP